MTTLDYPFTHAEATAARDEWGCNCGPAALAFAIQKPLDVARAAIKDFDLKRYTSPTMMALALRELRVGHDPVPAKDMHVDAMFAGGPALTRVQWTGPWTAPGANPKWAYIHTHWVATWQHDGAAYHGWRVFDINGGILSFHEWLVTIVPLLLPKKGDGDWKPTHIWRLKGGAS